MVDPELIRQLQRLADVSARLDHEVQRLGRDVHRLGERLSRHGGEIAWPSTVFEQPADVRVAATQMRLERARHSIENAERDLAAIRALVEGRANGIALREDIAEALDRGEKRIKADPSR